MKKSLVITTIAGEVNDNLVNISKKCYENSVELIIVADLKTGNLQDLKSTEMTVEFQKEMKSNLSDQLPWNSYSRKNLGYLQALKSNSTWILETDDDNIPSNEFFSPDLDSGIFLAKNIGWVNVYNYFGQPDVWQRGFPLNQISRFTSVEVSENIIAPEEVSIIQVLANGDPDVDAIFRLTRKLPIYFMREKPLAIGRNSISPFNSQATWWRREVAPLMYFPSHVSWRAADIWRSLVATRILHALGRYVVFYPAVVEQIRNAHDFMKDFAEEIDCYLKTEEVWENLERVEDGLINADIFTAIRHCYVSLVEANLIPVDELPLLELWISELTQIL